MKYIIIHKDEISSSLKAALNIGNNIKLIPIKNALGDASSYYVSPVKDENFSPHLSEYIRFNEEEIKIQKDLIYNGSSISHIRRRATKASAFQDSEGKRARFKGAIKMTIAAGEDQSQELLITEDRYITGGVYKAEGANFGDRVSFEVQMPYLDPEYGLIYVPVDTFLENWYVDDTKEMMEVYPAKIPAGLKIVITYNNVGSNSVNFYANLFLHKV